MSDMGTKRLCGQCIDVAEDVNDDNDADDSNLMHTHAAVKATSRCQSDSEGLMANNRNGA